MNEDLALALIKISCINIYILLVNYKIMNSKIRKIELLKIIGISILITGVYVAIAKYIDNILMIIGTYFIQLIFLQTLEKDSKNILFISNLISNAIVYIAFGVSMILEAFLIMTIGIKNKIINLILILIIETIMLLVFFRIKRFHHGFSFLQNKTNHDYLDIIMINISAVLILIYYLTGNYYGNLTKQLLICLIILAIIMVVMIQKTLTMYYKQKLLARTIEDYKLEISNKDKEIEKLSKEKYKISKLNHEFYNRQKALELKVQEFVNNTKLEIGQDLSVTKQIENLSKEYSNKLTKIKNPDKLPSTDIEEIDDMFKYMQSECSKNDIIFNLQVTDNIHYMINNIIEQDKLVTLIGDHIRDAIIAVSNSENKFKSIIAILGKKDNCYEFCVYDTGIEFEIDTLLKLGIEPATTHKDTGGTGIGFMTTFETMKETKASLIISENKPAEDDYTKSVAIRFDNKNEYRICSYRANQIKEKDTNNRIIIENKSIAK